jgi:hypothetical protein
MASLSAWPEPAQSAWNGASRQAGQGSAVGQGACVGAGGQSGHLVGSGHVGASGQAGHFSAVGHGAASGQGVDFPLQATSSAAIKTRNSPLIIRFLGLIAFSSNYHSNGYGYMKLVVIQSGLVMCCIHLLLWSSAHKLD